MKQFLSSLNNHTQALEINNTKVIPSDQTMGPSRCRKKSKYGCVSEGQAQANIWLKELMTPSPD